jgi:hypothetical protein
VDTRVCDAVETLNGTDSDGLRVTAFITDTGHGLVPGQLGGLELRHRQHARVEDRIRQAKATGLRNLPCHRAEANAAWLETILAATDLVAWTKLIDFRRMFVHPQATGVKRCRRNHQQLAPHIDQAVKISADTQCAIATISLRNDNSQQR